RSDESGTLREAAAIPISCTYVAPRAPKTRLVPRSRGPFRRTAAHRGLSLRAASLRHSPEGPDELIEGRLQSRASRVKHDVPLRPDFGPMQPEDLPQTALDSVARHGSAEGTRRRDSQPGARCAVRFLVSARTLPGQAEGCKQGAWETDAFLIDHSK